MQHNLRLTRSSRVRQGVQQKVPAGVRSQFPTLPLSPTLEWLFNLREGIGKKDDTLPKRFTDEPQIPDKPESRVRMDKMLPPYYKLRGWDANGVPTKATLRKFGLDFVKI